MKDFRKQTKQSLPNLEGMSGGGLWNISGYDIDHREPIIKLVGILIEYRRDMLIATKIDYVIAIIRKNYKLDKLPEPLIDVIV